MSLHSDMLNIGDQALEAARQLVLLNSRKKIAILQSMADALESRGAEIRELNQAEVQEGRDNGLPEALLDRLQVTERRMADMVKGLRAVAALKDPIGTRISRWIRPNGLEIVKQRVPIGVIAIIYESRPNVTADSAALCFKTSNAVILRGGKEALRTNTAIADALISGGTRKGMPRHAIQFVRTTDREAVRELVRMEGRVDLVIPRGGETLIRAVTENARVPVIKHYKGVCHVYVDESADRGMALNIIENAKCQRPAVCNAVETVLVHEAIAEAFLPEMAKHLSALGVAFRGDEAARRVVPSMSVATEADWTTEYLDLILSVRVVPSVQAAVEHINRCGSRHSDAIVAGAASAQKVFVQEVDSSTVYVNASTRFTDGGEFGMGAEIGISTDKLHARGPMGLEELTTYKYVVHGKGQIRP